VKGNVYIAGDFEGDTVDFDPGNGVHNLSSDGAFALKLNKNGNFVWAKKLLRDLQSTAIDAQGNFYIRGAYSGKVDFDPGVDTFYLTSVGGENLFINKLDSSGELVWAKSFGGVYQGGTQVNSLRLDSRGNIFMTGEFLDTVDVDPEGGGYNIVSEGKKDCYILKLLNKAVGIKESSLTSSKFEIFPNPTNGGVNIILNKKEKLKPILIYNSSAQLIREIIPTRTITSIDLNSYPNGLYIVLYNGESRKLILQK